MAEITNSLLIRQLKKLGLSENEPPDDKNKWLDFLKRVEKAYSESDEDRYTLERSLDLSSNEHTAMYTRSVEATTQLKINTEKLNAVLSSMSEGVLLINDNMNIEYANKAAENILEIEVDLVKGKKFNQLFGAPGWEDQCHEIINKKVEATIETRLQTASGKIIPIDIKFSPIRNKENIFLGSVLAFHCLEKQKQKEAEVEQAKLNTNKKYISNDVDIEQIRHESLSPKIIIDKSKNKVKILLVEDNKINQVVISRLLSNKGYNVDIAENGFVALDKLSESTYNLVLMDLHMPGMDGREATKIIRSDKSEKKNIPILAITADAISGVEDECLKIGMNGFITKPINYEELYRQIELHCVVNN